MRVISSLFKLAVHKDAFMTGYYLLGHDREKSNHEKLTENTFFKVNNHAPIFPFYHLGFFKPHKFV